MLKKWIILTLRDVIRMGILCGIVYVGTNLLGWSHNEMRHMIYGTIFGYACGQMWIGVAFGLAGVSMDILE